MSNPIVLIDTTNRTMSQSHSTTDLSISTTNQSPRTVDQSLCTTKTRQSRLRWTWEETVNLIDYVEDRKSDEALTVAQRLEFCAQETFHDVFPALSAQQLFRRIELLSYNWVNKKLSGSSTLYKHGWSAMKATCSRKTLLSNPSNTERPRSKERRSRRTEPESLTDWLFMSDTSKVTSAARTSVSASDHNTSLSPSSFNLGYYLGGSLQNYIQNPAQYLSDLGQIHCLEKRLLTEIGKAVDTLLVRSRIEKHRQPLLEKAFESPVALELLNIVYGATTERELQYVLAGERSQSYLELGELLEVILASAITTWVLQRQHDKLPQDPSQRKLSPTEKDIRDVLPAAIEQGLRRERYLSVANRVGWETCIDSLTARFSFGTIPFLEQNVTNFATDAGQWLKSLQTVFATALEMDGQFLLWPQGIHVDWPQYGESYNPVHMRPVDNSDGTGKKVRAALFPAVVEKKALLDGTLQEDSSEGILFRAKVLLQ